MAVKLQRRAEPIAPIQTISLRVLPIRQVEEDLAVQAVVIQKARVEVTVNKTLMRAEVMLREQTGSMSPYLVLQLSSTVQAVSALQLLIHLKQPTAQDPVNIGTVTAVSNKHLLVSRQTY